MSSEVAPPQRAGMMQDQSEVLPALKSDVDIDRSQPYGLPMHTLIHSSITADMIREHNEQWTNERLAGDKVKNQSQERTRATDMLAAMPEGMVAYGSLLHGYLKQQIRAGIVDTRDEAHGMSAPEKFRDLVDAYGAYRRVNNESHRRYTIGEVNYSGSRIVRELEPGLRTDEDIEIAGAALKTVHGDLKRDVTNVLLEKLGLIGGSSKVAGFAINHMPEETFKKLVARKRTYAELIRLSGTDDSKDVEHNVTNYLMQVARGMAGSDFVLPAVKKYYSGEYPEALLTVKGREKRPDYAGSMVQLTMYALKGLKELKNNNAKIMYDYLLTQGSGRVQISGQAEEAVRPPTSAFVVIANQLSSSLAQINKKDYKPIVANGTETALIDSIHRIVEALSVMGKGLKKPEAKKLDNQIVCVQLVTGRFEQFIDARTNASRLKANQSSRRR